MGVLATRSPHRPVPIGLSVAQVGGVPIGLSVAQVGGVPIGLSVAQVGGVFLKSLTLYG